MAFETVVIIGLTGVQGTKRESQKEKSVVKKGRIGSKKGKIGDHATSGMTLILFFEND